MRRLVLSLIFFIWLLSLHASVSVPYTHGGPLAPDSSNFVTASIVIFTPGDNVYGSLGHCAMRMECPVHDLDYCFSLETDVAVADYIKFFSGRARAAFFAVPTDEFMQYYRDHGRGAVQYELNLTLHEKQELWRMLDDDMVAGAHRKFNFMENNCTSSLLLILEQAILPARIQFVWPDWFGGINGESLRRTTKNKPWTMFWCVVFSGTEADAYWQKENKVSPETLPLVLSSSSIVDDSGQSRPVFLSPRPLLREQAVPDGQTVTPLLLFGALLALLVLLTVLEWRLGGMWCQVCRWVDVVLFVLQSLAGVLLLYMTVVSGLFGVHWNWYLIPFNPVPLVMWLLFRHTPWYRKLFGLYAVVLVCFVLATPLSSQLDVEHQLLSVALAVRCAAHCWFSRGSKPSHG